jgi:alcohol dehydrogenase class IV
MWCFAFLKHLTVILDSHLMNEPFGTSILELLQSNGIKYEVQKQAQPNIITFWRAEAVVTEEEPKKVIARYQYMFTYFLLIHR